MKKFPISTFSISFFSSCLVHFSMWAFFFIKPDSTNVLKVFKSEPPIMLTLTEPVKRIKNKQIVEQEKKQLHKVQVKANYLSASNNTVEKETQAEDTGAFSNNLERESRSQSTLSDFKISAVQRSKASDYLKDVQRSAQTLLNTREVASYQYHIKIRNAVHSQWTQLIQNRNDEIQADRRQSTKPLWEQKTKLIFSLSNSGNLINIRVVDSSGLPSLDQIAIDAFERAQPFSPPPQELLDTNGELRMQWDFIIENTL